MIATTWSTLFLKTKKFSYTRKCYKITSLATKRLATYYGDIKVGFGRNNEPSKTQSFKMLFDTGSCEFWIPSVDCNDKRCLSHTRYSTSSTFEAYTKSMLEINYLSGSVEGGLAYESIQLGDIVIPQQVIGIAKNINIPLLDVTF